MLGKLFKKNQPTDIVGKDDSKSSKSGDTRKAAYITIPKLENHLNYKLEKKVTVGSQVGDFLIQDENIAPRHCSFFINKGIISVMDHSSSTGTFLNKKQLDPGKIFILSEKDKIRLGKLDLKIEYMDVPVMQEMQVPKEDEVLEEYEDETATHVMQVASTDELPENTGEFNTEELMVEDNAELDMQELEIPDLPSFEDEFEEDLSEPSLEEEVSKAPQATETAEGEASPAESIDISDVDVEEEMLDESFLPTKVREKHIKENEKRAKLLAKEKEENSEDLAGFEVTSTGIKALQLDDLKEEESSDKKDSIKAALAKRKKNRKPVKARGTKAKVKKAKDPASSFLTRLFALINDIVLCLILLEIFYVYTDVKAVYDNLSEDIWNVVGPHYNEFVLPQFNKYTKDIKEVGEVLASVKKFTDSHNVFEFAIFVMVFRILFGMILSVSLGQLLVGMRASGKFLWKRIVYPIREVLGLVTLPLLIFDLPALISKRTFKEVILFSQYLTPKPRLTVVSAFIITPLLLIGLGVAPFYKGLEVPPPVKFSENTKSLKKWNGGQKILINSMGMNVHETETLKVLPSFRVTMKNKSKRLRPGVLLVDTQTGGILSIQKVKSFSMLKMYSSFVDLNYLAFQFQPEIHSYVRDVSRKNDDFKPKKTNKLNLEVETIKLIKSVNDYNLDIAPDFFIENGFLLRGFRDFREKFDNIFTSKLDEVQALAIGNSKGIMGHFQKGRDKSFEYFPLNFAKPNLYQLSANVSKANLKTIIRSIEMVETKDKKDKIVSSNPTSKLIDSFTNKRIRLTNNDQQEIFKNYYQVVKTLMESDKKQAIKKLEKEIQQAMNALSVNSKNNRRLNQKLNQILQAIKNQDLQFFQIKNNKKKTV